MTLRSVRARTFAELAANFTTPITYIVVGDVDVPDVAQAMMTFLSDHEGVVPLLRNENPELFQSKEFLQLRRVPAVVSCFAGFYGDVAYEAWELPRIITDARAFVPACFPEEAKLVGVKGSPGL